MGDIANIFFQVSIPRSQLDGIPRVYVMILRGVGGSDIGRVGQHLGTVGIPALVIILIVAFYFRVRINL